MIRGLLIVLLFIAGCGKKDEGAVMIPIEQVPKTFMEQAQKELPDVTFDTARKLSNGNIEVRGKNKLGKVQEVEFNAEGKVVEIER